MRNRKQRMVSQIPVRAEVTHFSHDGRGIAHIDGKTTFIRGALAHEEVMFRRLRSKKQYDEGEVLEVLRASPHRVEPKCPHYTMCGGCSLQHLDEAMQIHEKQDWLANLLERIGHVTPETFLAPLTSEAWHYRNKARLSVRYVEKKGSTLVGFRERNNPRFITDIQECPVLHPRVDAHLVDLRRLIDSFAAPASIAQIEVAAGDEDVGLIFRHMTPLTDADKAQLRLFADETQMSIYLQPAGPDSITLFYPEKADPYLYYELPDEGLRFAFHPRDFTQINMRLNRLMIQQAMDLLALKSDDRLLDLFCGLGNFSLPAARRCAKVIGVEGSDEMVGRATMNARLNHLDHVDFYCADLTKTDIFEQLQSERFTHLLIDPPRTGALEIVREVNRISPQRIVYVSCNPATLARDADVLVNQHGYELKAVGVMDMFPHTAHVESIALFTQGR